MFLKSKCKIITCTILIYFFVALQTHRCTPFRGDSSNSEKGFQLTYNGVQHISLCKIFDRQTNWFQPRPTPILPWIQHNLESDFLHTHFVLYSIFLCLEFSHVMRMHQICQCNTNSSVFENMIFTKKLFFKSVNRKN